jgi:glycosyltransferase involved in cell wall biosynthesis
MRISVVVPAYNAAKTVAATLDALLVQSLPGLEIVVVDDGSKDQTREVLEPYRDRVRLVFQENGGVSAARNRGVSETSGDWVAFCDADDLWHKDKLQVMSAVLQAWPSVDLAFHEFWTLVDGRVAEERATHSQHTMFPLFRELDISIPRILTDHRRVDTAVKGIGAIDTWYGSGFRWLMLGNFLMPSTVMIRRTAFDDAGGFDANFRYAEDTEFFLRFGKSRSMVWADVPLTGYRREAGTLLTGNMYPTVKNATRAVEKHCVDDHSVYNGPDRGWVRKAVARRMSRFAYFCLTELNRAEARVYARKALGHYPGDLRTWLVLVGSFVPQAALAAVRRAKSRRRE